jgi:hypothetical protein
MDRVQNEYVKSHILSIGVQLTHCRSVGQNRNAILLVHVPVSRRDVLSPQTESVVVKDLIGNQC